MPGEDPFLSGQYAINYIRGCQQVSKNPQDKPFPKMLSYLKHYTAYNVETNRFTFSADVSLYVNQFIWVSPRICSRTRMYSDPPPHPSGRVRSTPSVFSRGGSLPPPTYADGRSSDDVIAFCRYDFWDTYLPQYEAAFTKGGASGAMCSYMAANNVSSCGSNWLMNEVIRERWQRPVKPLHLSGFPKNLHENTVLVL